MNQSEFTIKIDPREQKPYVFTVPYIFGTLKTGDYSICGHEDRICVERKSLEDLIGCLTTGRDRFERELERGKTLAFFCLVVEGSLSDIACGRYRSGMLPKAAVQSILAFSVRYRLPVFFAESRAYGQRLTESILQKYMADVERTIKKEGL